jgi:hypothetical protein
LKLSPAVVADAVFIISAFDFDFVIHFSVLRIRLAVGLFAELSSWLLGQGSTKSKSGINGGDPRLAGRKPFMPHSKLPLDAGGASSIELKARGEEYPEATEELARSASTQQQGFKKMCVSTICNVIFKML